MDATEAYRNACLNAIEYLTKWGYTGEQAYLILGTSPIEGRDHVEICHGGPRQVHLLLKMAAPQLDGSPWTVVTDPLRYRGQAVHVEALRGTNQARQNGDALVAGLSLVV